MAKAKIQNLKVTPVRSVTRRAVKKATPDLGLVYTSSNMQSLHETADALREAKLFDAKTMRKLDELCLSTAPEFDSDACIRIRKSTNVSQAVFAVILGASLSTVQKWESGANPPSGISARMLQLVEKHGLRIFE